MTAKLLQLWLTTGICHCVLHVQ